MMVEYATVIALQEPAHRLNRMMVVLRDPKGGGRQPVISTAFVQIHTSTTD